MKLLSFTVLALAAVVARGAKDEDADSTSPLKEKRGAGYSSQAAQAQEHAQQVAYSKLAQAQAQAQALQPQQKGISYVAAPQGVQFQGAQYFSQPGVRYYTGQAPHQQQQYQFEAPQAAAYAQLSAGKGQGAPQHQSAKVSSFIPSQPQQNHYSSAADVSSFSYSSPVVKYSNLGVLSQVIGKLASQAGLTHGSSLQAAKSAASSASSQPSSQVAYTHQIQPLIPQPAAKGLYSGASVPSSPQAAVYQSQAPSQKYAFVPQKSFSFAAAPSSKYSPSSGAGPTKYAIVAAPQYQAVAAGPQYQAISASPQYQAIAAGQQYQAASPQHQAVSSGASQHSQASAGIAAQYSQASAVPQAYSFDLPDFYSSAVQQQAAKYASAASLGGHAASTGPQTFTDAGKDGASQGDEGQAYKQVYLAQPSFAYSSPSSGQQQYSAQAPSAAHTVQQPIYSSAPEYYTPQADKYTPSRYVPAQ